MESQNAKDVDSWDPLTRTNLKQDCLFNLQPNKAEEINNTKIVYELRLNSNENFVPPEAAGRRNGGSRGGGGRKSKRGGGGREGERKRHPNFAARNRKIGKGGPTGRGSFYSTRRRRPMGPRPPKHEGDDPEYNTIDVDPKTGRSKRIKRPKSDEAEEKEKLRREEDKVRKSGKKTRPGPKQKDRKDIKEKLRRFWRETPKPKDKKAPKFVTDGLNADREKPKKKKEPKDFDDLRMPSKNQLKKREKLRKKAQKRKEKKLERENDSHKIKENVIEGEYVPTLSEIEGLEGDFQSYMDIAEKFDDEKISPKIRLKLKPKKSNAPEREYHKFEDINTSFLDYMKENKLNLEQHPWQGKENVEDPLVSWSPDYSVNRLHQKYKDEDEEENVMQSELSFEEDSVHEEATDLSRESKIINAEAGQKHNWEEYREKALKMRDKRSKLIPGTEMYEQHVNKTFVEDKIDSPTASSNDQNKDSSDKNLLNKRKGKLKQSDMKLDDEVYEDIKEYLLKESEIQDNIEQSGPEPQKKISSVKEEYQTASDEYEIWDSVKKTFRKPRKRVKTRSATVLINEENEHFREENGEISQKFANGSIDRPDTLPPIEPPAGIVDEIGSDYSSYHATDDNTPSINLDNKEEKPITSLKKNLENIPKTDIKETLKETSVFIDKSFEAFKRKSGLQPTGSVVDEKLESLYEELKGRGRFKSKEEFLDDVGPLLFNDDEEMFNIEGLNTSDDQEDEGLQGDDNRDFDLKDYEQYKENMSEIRTQDESVSRSRKTASHEEKNYSESPIESETTDTVINSDESNDDNETSESEYREEYDIALMAGLKSDRVWVGDEGVERYAQMDHQAARFRKREPLPTQETLSDLEYERAMKNGELNGKKPCDDDVLVSTESERPKTKRSRKKKVSSKKSSLLERDKAKIKGKAVSAKIDQLIGDAEEPDAQTRSHLTPAVDQRPSADAQNKSIDILQSVEIKSLNNQLKGTQEADESNDEKKLVKTIEAPDHTILESGGEPQSADIPDPKLTTQKENSDASDAATRKKQAISGDIDIFGSDIDDIDLKEDEEDKYKDNEFLKDEWRQFVINANECFGDQVDFPMEMPDYCPSEEDTDAVQAETLERHAPSVTQIESSSGAGKIESLQKNESTTPTSEEVDESTNLEKYAEAEKSKEVVSSENLTGEVFKPTKGINEYLEEDDWELWYRFIKLMNNNKTRSFDNCVALFKAKKQEILTRTEAPIPPWEEPGLDEYERTRRKVQREWEKTERHYALKGQEKFVRFLQENEGEPKEVEIDSALVDTFRTVFDLINSDDYDHEAYKDSLSREELAEVYTDEEELEEELRQRELRKKGKFQSDREKAEAAGDTTFLSVPSIEHASSTLQTFVNSVQHQFSHYDTEPEWIKNDPTNPLNYKVYSKKMNVQFENPKSSHKVNKVTEFSINEPPIKQESSSPGPFRHEENIGLGNTADGNKTQLSKREQAKKMWQHFVQLMKERHEKNIEKFILHQPVTKKNNEEEARYLWKQYVAFMSGQPMPERKQNDESDTIYRDIPSEQIDRPILNPDYIPEKKETPQYNEHDFPYLQKPVFEKTDDLPSSSVGWRTLIERVQAIKMDSNGPNYPPQQEATGYGQPQRPQGSYSSELPVYEDRYYGGAPPPRYLQREQFRPSPALYPEGPGVYSQQGQFAVPGQGYPDTPRRPPPRGPPRDPFYGPPMYQSSAPPITQQPRGLQGMSQYHQHFATQRGNTTDPYGKPLPPNVSFNRAYNSPEMGFQNPYFTQAMDDRAAWPGNLADPYTANRLRVGWPGDHSDKFHNRKYFVPDMGGQQTYIPEDLSGQPGDHSDRYYNRSNFRNPNFGYRTDTFNRSPFERGPLDPNERSIRWWQSGTRPLASSGLQSGPSIPSNTADPSQHSYEAENQYSNRKTDSSWPPQSRSIYNDEATSSQTSSQTKLPDNVQHEEFEE